MDINSVKSAVSDSNKLYIEGKVREALDLLDNAIAEAIEDGQTRWLGILSMHAAALSGFGEDRSRIKHYCEQLLKYDPENPMALYRSAQIANGEGRTDDARQYATKCHQILVKLEDWDFVKQGLFESHSQAMARYCDC